MKVSGFSFVHNALEGGYPIVEAVRAVQPYVDEVVVADCASTDGTPDVLKRLGVVVLEGRWGNKAGETLAEAHALNSRCGGAVIVHFEADEVYDETLVLAVRDLVSRGVEDIAVHRLQLEQNFQRCRWYPEPVHRVFPRGSVIKVGHTTNRHREARVLPPSVGLLWDCTNCFRDNWEGRVKNQAELWDEPRRFRRVPLHFKHDTELTPLEVQQFLTQDHWTWKTTPFALPEMLRPLVGMVKYNARV